MTLPALLSFLVIGGSFNATAEAEKTITGEYACSVHEKAGITSIHLEGADPPTAYLEHDIQSTFGMSIEKTAGGEFSYKVTETPDRGENPDRMDYHTQFSLLHSDYYGDGWDFTAAEDQAFLRLYRHSNGRFFFYHAGFEYPGGEDVRLSVRYGECRTKS